MRQQPILYQLNTRVFLEDLGQSRGRAATLDDITEAVIDELLPGEIDMLWLLGVWRTGTASRRVSLDDPGLRAEAERTLPDLRDEDICGSPFAITAYEVRQEWGGNAALLRLRKRLAQRGVRLLLDFVPNHVGLDHPWVEEHPEYFIQGNQDDLQRDPCSWVRVPSRGGSLVLAHGKDPYFPAWRDTLQLDYRHAGLRDAMRQQLIAIAELCDAVRCDMAMLIQPDIFAQTWQDRPSAHAAAPFWPDTVEAVRRGHRSFMFVAEVYWNREYELQQDGFDFTYDKELYDRLRAADERAGRRVREHLLADIGYQARCVRFLENHDEPRAASTFAFEAHRAAAILTYLVPGLRFFHDGQLEGRRVRVSMHVGRRPGETSDPDIQRFYAQLLPCLRRPEIDGGQWQLCNCRPPHEDPTDDTWRDVIAMTWTHDGRSLLVVVNYAPQPGRCGIELGLSELAGQRLRLADILSDVRYAREADAVALELPAWGFHVFELGIEGDA